MVKDDHSAALELFQAKFSTVVRVVRFRAGRARIRAADVDDLIQIAGLRLWQICRRAVQQGFVPSSRLVASEAFEAWRVARDRDPVTKAVNIGMKVGEGTSVAAGIPAQEPAIRVDGVTLTASDARLDHPELISLFETGITASEVARRIGCTVSNVLQTAAARFGGHRFGRRWLFPADTALAAGAA